MKAVFLDRDGVINKYPGHFEYVKSWKEFHFLPGIKPALKKLNSDGFELFVVSNQAGVAKGIYPLKNLQQITKNMLKDLSKTGVNISGVYYCTHCAEDNCSCRKPKTGLVDNVVANLKKEGKDLKLAESYFIGDSLIDMETAKAAGLKAILVFSGKEKPQNQNSWQNRPDFIAQNLSEAVDLIIGGETSEHLV